MYAGFNKGSVMFTAWIEDFEIILKYRPAHTPSPHHTLDTSYPPRQSSPVLPHDPCKSSLPSPPSIPCCRDYDSCRMVPDTSHDRPMRDVVFESALLETGDDVRQQELGPEEGNDGVLQVHRRGWSRHGEWTEGRGVLILARIEGGRVKRRDVWTGGGLF
ncbi:uncharacterized protein ARMOST_22628 [Armillaria ostoyae]|uniref:Uncharacterized protein n=1 Tax=Armillaria ostoyae TaxID=47428 RepID=A0A284SDD6_ARMOS|nr:uncharacterized protein ARMOST_22628 [Armillaria ostoyae]